MSIAEKIGYLDSKIEFTNKGGWHVDIDLDKPILDKLNTLLDRDWWFRFNGDEVMDIIQGKEADSGILYINLMYNIVKKLETEGKL